MSAAPLIQRYDDVPYVGLAFGQTHPDRMAVMARLFGMEPAPVESCRVLELGCGDGGNLIPMACAMPGCDFVGGDAAARGIRDGLEVVSALGLGNIRLMQLNILDAGADLGQFDYIICHGVYSWVPPNVQNKLLAACRALLKPHGVAYISYNVRPGGEISRMISGMMKYHVRRFAEPVEQTEQAAALIAFLASRPSTDAYGAMLKGKLENLSSRRLQSIFHDELSEYNEALYFHEFAARAGAQGLQYLGEAEFFAMCDATETPEIRQALAQLGSHRIEREQYLDFLRGRSFRQTLLCHAEVPLDHEVNLERLREFFVETAKRSGAVEPGPSGQHPFAVAVETVLRESYPMPVSFSRLLDEAHARVPIEDGEQTLSRLLLTGFEHGQLQLRTTLPRFVLDVSERPRAGALIRLAARSGPLVVNLRHDMVRCEDELSREVLTLLDGTRGRAALIEALSQNHPRETVESGIDQCLAGLAKCAVLEA